MLLITVKAYSVFNETTDEFITVNEPTKLKMENSLVAISEWEKKFKKPWFPDPKASKYYKENEGKRTQEEMLYFIKCMIFKVNDTLVDGPDDVDDKLLFGLTDDDYKKIGDYLSDSQTALKSIPETKPDKKHKSDPIKMTSERVYAWLAEEQISFAQVEYWNINRLMNVIQIINYDNTPDDRKKRQKPFEVAQDYARINEERLKKLGTKG